MSPRRTAHDAPALPSRRALAARLTAGAAALGFARLARAAVPAPAQDPALRDAALRGLALACHRGDPVAAAAAEATLARLAETDPEAALLGRIYRALDVRPAAFWQADLPAAGPADLAVLHTAIRDCQPVHFGYTDLSEQCSDRTVLPLALVHPPQGVKLLAWCEKAQGYRQFFVRAMRDPAPRPGDFRAARLALLRGLAEKERA